MSWATFLSSWALYSWPARPPYFNLVSFDVASPVCFEKNSMAAWFPPTFMYRSCSHVHVSRTVDLWEIRVRVLLSYDIFLGFFLPLPDKTDVNTEVPMSRGALCTDINAKRNRWPGGIFRHAVKASLPPEVFRQRVPFPTICSIFTLFYLIVSVLLELLEDDINLFLCWFRHEGGSLTKRKSSSHPQWKLPTSHKQHVWILPWSEIEKDPKSFFLRSINCMICQWAYGWSSRYNVVRMALWWFWLAFCASIYCCLMS